MKRDPAEYGKTLLDTVLEEQQREPWLSCIRRCFPGWRKRAFRRAVQRLAGDRIARTSPALTPSIVPQRRAPEPW
jgi:hypothetical protein